MVSHLLILMGVIILYTSSYEYQSQQIMTNTTIMIILILISTTSLIIFGIIGIIKYNFALQIHSRSLLKDSYFDFISTIISINVCITNMVLCLGANVSLPLLHFVMNALVGLISICIGIYPLYNCFNVAPNDGVLEWLNSIITVVPYSDEFYGNRYASNALIFV